MVNFPRPRLRGRAGAYGHERPCTDVAWRQTTVVFAAQFARFLRPFCDCGRRGISSADCHGKQTAANHRDAAGCDPRRLRGCGCRAAHTRGKTAHARAAPGADPCAKRRADTMRAMLLHRRFGGTCRWAYAFCNTPPASARCIRREHTGGADVRPRAITSG